MPHSCPRNWTLGLGLLCLAAIRLECASPALQAPEALHLQQEPRSVARDRLGDPLPPGAIARLGTTRLRHLGPVYRVAFAPDGRTFASASGDRTVRLWDAVTGEERLKLTGHEDFVSALAFSRDGKRLASGGLDAFVRVWDLAGGKELFKLPGHNRPVQTVAFSADGKKLAVGMEGAVFLWDAHSGKEIVKPEEFADERVSSLALSADCATVALGAWSGDVRLNDVVSGDERMRLLGHDKPIRGIAFSLDGTLLATASSDRTVRLWNAQTGREIRALEDADEAYSVAFSPDGATVAAGTKQGRITLWDHGTGREARRFSAHEGAIFSLAFSPNGSALLSGGLDQVVHLWRVASGEEGIPRPGHAGAVSGIAVHPQTNRLASAGHDQTVRLWDAGTGKQLWKGMGHEGRVHAVAFSPRGVTLASGGEDRTIRLWDVSSGKERRALEGHEAPVGCVAFSPYGATLASGSADQTVRLWEVETGRELRVLKARSSMVIVHSVAFSPDGKWLASASLDRVVRVWNVETGEEARALKGHEGNVTCVVFSPDGMTLASAADGAIRLWESATDRLLLTMRGHEGAIASVSFSSDGKWIASAGYDRTVRLWDVATGKQLWQREGHAKEITGVCVWGTEHVASASADTTILIWDLAPESVAPGRLPAEDAERLWKDLAGEDGPRAYKAMWRLAAAADQAIDLIRGRLDQERPSAEEVERLLEELDHEDVAVRDRAARRLVEFEAEEALRGRLERDPGPELRARIETLLEDLRQRRETPIAADAPSLQRIRAIQVLERVGTPEALEALERLAGHAPWAGVRRDAKAASARLKARR